MKTLKNIFQISFAQLLLLARGFLVEIHDLEKESCRSILNQAKSSGDMLFKHSDLQPLS